MTELIDLEAAGIPYLDYRTFIMRVLFPNDPDHPLLHHQNEPMNNQDPIKNENVERGLRQFNHLLCNKTFILIFIRTVEADRKCFNMRDRVNVASLLMIVFQCESMPISSEDILPLDSSILPSFIYSFIYSFIHSFIHSFIFSSFHLCSSPRVLH